MNMKKVLGPGLRLVAWVLVNIPGCGSVTIVIEREIVQLQIIIIVIVVVIVIVNAKKWNYCNLIDQSVIDMIWYLMSASDINTATDFSASTLLIGCQEVRATCKSYSKDFKRKSANSSEVIRLGTVCHLSWDVLLWAPPLGVVWRRSCSLELMGFLLTLSSRVLCPGLESAVRPFWTAPGLTSLHSISAQLS